MIDQPQPRSPVGARPFPVVSAIVLAAALAGCAGYANLSFAVKDRASLRYFPPFERGIDANHNRHLGAEYFNIAKSLVAGDGFANPFSGRSGPTAWMPPLLPGLLAGLLWACNGDRDAVMAVVIFLQTAVLIGTGLLVLALARQTTSRLWPGAAALVFFLWVVCDFHAWFQFTHDCWLVLLALDLLVAGLCWLRPLAGWRRAAGWGVFGGFCALVGPVVAFTWGLLSLGAGLYNRSWSRLALALAVAGLTLAPWTLRNFLVFGRVIPIKSNAAYELYQSQCLQKDGLIQRTTFDRHPYGKSNRERQEYQLLGEMAYLDRKGLQFRQALAADPVDFLDRLASRFLGATLWYVPFDRAAAPRKPWATWLGRLTHPLPFLAALGLLFAAVAGRLPRFGAVVLGAYLLYLLPYVAVSYYDRYAFPLLLVKVLLLIGAIDQLLCLLPTRTRTSVTRRASCVHAKAALAGDSR